MPCFKSFSKIIELLGHYMHRSALHLNIPGFFDNTEKVGLLSPSVEITNWHSSCSFLTFGNEDWELAERPALGTES